MASLATVMLAMLDAARAQPASGRGDPAPQPVQVSRVTISLAYGAARACRAPDAALAEADAAAYLAANDRPVTVEHPALGRLPAARLRRLELTVDLGLPG